MIKSKAFFAGLFCTAVACAGLSAPAQAQDYPTKPITIIVPTGPGSAVDVLARLIGEQLTAKWGQQIVVENVGGAGGSIGAAKLAAAPSDGYTLGFVPANLTTHPYLYDIPYDVKADFTPIVQVSGASLVMYVSPALGANTVAEVVEMAKAKPGDLTYASAGNGSIAHLAAELFKNVADVDITQVNYENLNLATVDVIAGRVSMVFMSAGQGMPQVREGQLRAIGTTGMTPNPGAPDVPQIANEGVAGYEIRSWFGLIGPKDLPDAIVTKVHDAVVEIAEGAEFQAALAKIGQEPILGTPAEFRQAIDAELEKWGKIIAQTGSGK